jgi:hypothetical protein
MDWTWLVNWINQWGNYTVAQHLTHALAGLLGGALYSVIITPDMKWPHRNKATGHFRLEIVGNLFVGITCGFIADHSVPVGFAAGLFGLPLISEAIAKGIPAAWRGFVTWSADQISKEGKK